MALSIANNLSAFTAQRSLNRNDAALGASLQRLASGYRVNVAADDPAALVISEQLRSQKSGIARAVQNTQEAANVLAIAEGALSEMNSILAKLNQLAIHAANAGVVSPEQVAADQAEVDSSVQTLDRIARTTAYSDENLLNGNKEIEFTATTRVVDSRDMALVNRALSDVRQIFSRDLSLNINFAGATESGGGLTPSGNEAEKGYFEATRNLSPATQIAADSTLSADQTFTLTGNSGSRVFSFAAGTHLGEMVGAINSVGDSTGVKAHLTFDNEVFVNGASGYPSGDGVVTDGTTALADMNGHATGTADFYNRDESGAPSTAGVATVTVSRPNDLELGVNLDGYGRAYLKMTTADRYVIYKDAAMTMPVATGSLTASSGASVTQECNDSGFNGVALTFSSPNAPAAGAVTTLQLGVEHEDATIYPDALPVTASLFQHGGVRHNGEATEVQIVSGKLEGLNDGEGLRIFINSDRSATLTRADGSVVTTALPANVQWSHPDRQFIVGFNNGFTAKIHYSCGQDPLYSFTSYSVDCTYIAPTDAADSGINMRGLESAARITGVSTYVNAGSFLSGVDLGVNTSQDGRLYVKAEMSASGPSNIRLYRDPRMRDEDLMAESGAVDLTTTGIHAVRLFATQNDDGSDSGLYGTLNFSSVTQDFTIDGAAIDFTNLAVRLSAAEYGSDAFVKVDAAEGALWSSFDAEGNPELMVAGLSGVSRTQYGSDAAIAVNGQRVTLDGIGGTLANLDATADVVFNEGGLGTTTLAAVGYDSGAWGARAGRMADARDNHVTHALHATTEVLGDFTGGMQLQLGEGAGAQNRTVVGIDDMTAVSLGRTRFHDYFGNRLKIDKTLAIADLMSGGAASLENDPVKAMAIVKNAIRDVTGLRADLGAWQSNLLETNASSLQVAMENIAKTESYIRDTDMAAESISYAENQVLAQAATSMLAQANSLPETILTLIAS